MSDLNQSIDYIWTQNYPHTTISNHKLLHLLYEKDVRFQTEQEKISDINLELTKGNLSSFIYSKNKCKNFTDYLIDNQFGRFFQKQFHDIKKTKFKNKSLPTKILKKVEVLKIPIDLNSDNKLQPAVVSKYRCSIKSINDISVKLDRESLGRKVEGISLFELTQTKDKTMNSLRDSASSPNILKSKPKVASDSITQWSTTVYQSNQPNYTSTSLGLYKAHPKTTISQSTLPTAKSTKKRLAFDMINNKLQLSRPEQPLFLNPIINIRHSQVSSLILKSPNVLK